MITEVDRFVFVGTAHVSKQSVKEIKDAIERYKPEVVAIELDYMRLKSLLSKTKKRPSFLSMSKEYGFSGALFGLVASFVQNKAGKLLNVDPGLDMKAAYEIARDNKIPTALIDQNVKITLKNFSNLRFSKKMKLFSSLFMSGFKKENSQKLNFDIREGVPSEEKINEILDIVKKEAPILYKILISDRNKFMVRRLMELRENHKGIILVVVGAGHVRGMTELIHENNGTSYYYSYNVHI